MGASSSRLTILAAVAGMASAFMPAQVSRTWTNKALAAPKSSSAVRSANRAERLRAMQLSAAAARPVRASAEGCRMDAAASARARTTRPRLAAASAPAPTPSRAAASAPARTRRLAAALGLAHTWPAAALACAFAEKEVH
eukprot:CAMPEP_0172583356 /NCGR_PEP_ID=MMETSP1068-20121228/2965_1 /TAXON_ID=35684 /ORGANISM="Pseudopedinella elastica, Strain CCMP716" /LENGTH=139 /DNA_ID=CAMNT_0013377107 /DNA_START=95 /DNA_END=515 /DNA_ORIENTATION=+